MPRRCIVGLLLLVAACWAASPAAAAEPLADRWVYVQTNLQVDANSEQLETLLRRAKAAGYNGVLLADYKFNVLDRVTKRYFLNARRIRDLCRELGLELVPAIGSFGYSAGILAHDPNLAEGLPVRDLPLVVRGGRAVLADAGRNLVPGELEDRDGDRFRGWNFQDAIGSGTYADTEVRHGGQSSLRIENPPGVRQQRRINKRVAVRPFTQLHASVWIRTEGFENPADARMFAIGQDGRTLSYTSLSVKQDQDWTEHHVVLNTLDNQEILFYVGVWDAGSGKLWIDDVRLVEEPFVNLVRREACPLVVRAAQGDTVYEEGRDFAPLADPKLGVVPYAGEYSIYHAPPELTIPAGSRIREGDELRVSYYHTVKIYDDQTCCSLSDPKVFEIVAEQIRGVQELLEPRTWMLAHDEIRVANWSATDEQAGKSAGQVLADNVRRVIELVRSHSPGARICIWSDMFDPHHNARDKYYLVRGDLAGAWEGLPPEVTIINWNSGKSAQSLPFFGQRGHTQILAGYYDHRPEAIRGWLDTATPGDRVTGVMYTTWRDNYDDLEAFARAAWGQPPGK